MSNPSPAALSAPALLALALPSGSRVLVVGAGANAFTAALAERGCDVSRAASVDEAGAASDAPFDAVVLADGFEALADPVNALRGLGKLVTDDGQLVLVAENASHAAARLAVLVGRADDAAAPLPQRRYDLAALERVVRDAGFGVVDRLRVITPVPAGDFDALAPGLAALVSGPEANTATFVLLTQRAERAGAVGPTLAETLQRALDDAQAELAQVRGDLAEVEEKLRVASGALTDAELQLDDQSRELQTRADALVERVEEIERLHAQRRHLELEIVVKDDYISILRRDRNDWRDLHAALQFEMDELKRSRHYKVAAAMHSALKRVPLLHRVATFAARRAMAARRRNA